MRKDVLKQQIKIVADAIIAVESQPKVTQEVSMLERNMKEKYKSQPHRKYAVPVEVDVYGDVTPEQVAEYLHRASILSVRAEEFGNGPTADSYVAPVIHWGYLKPIDVVKEDPDKPALDWGIGPDIENL